MQHRTKFGIGVAVIVASLAGLAWLGYGESKTYYHTIAELHALNSGERAQRIRVGGTVEAGSVRRSSGRVDFVLEGEGEKLPVSYAGADPLPDTFADRSQALVEGRLGDGAFVAERVQAKCASKYEANPGSTASTTSSSSQPSAM